MPTNDRLKSTLFRRALAIALLGAGMCGLFSACSTVHAPTYTDAELQAQCERRGGWWRGSLIPGAASSGLLGQAPEPPSSRGRKRDDPRARTIDSRACMR
jgi:hypothetical protein